jgi:hypothetical protein
VAYNASIEKKECTIHFADHAVTCVSHPKLRSTNRPRLYIESKYGTCLAPTFNGSAPIAKSFLDNIWCLESCSHSMFVNYLPSTVLSSPGRCSPSQQFIEGYPNRQNIPEGHQRSTVPDCMFNIMAKHANKNEDKVLLCATTEGKRLFRGCFIIDDYSLPALIKKTAN